MKGIEGHARIPMPGWEDIQAEAALSGVMPEVAARKLLAMRAAEIEAEQADPIRCGWEPPIWKVADALLGFPVCWDRGFLQKIRQKAEGRRQNEKTDEKTDEEVWSEYCRRMRKALGYERPVKMLLVMGGNRAAKSEYAAKRAMMLAAEKSGARVYALHMSEPRSVRDQQPLFWKYMPAEWQVQSAGVTTYIKFKKKTGFAENSFILPNGSEGAFMNYMQDKDTALQGLEADLIAPDELIPADWVEDIMLRLATRAGMGVLTFTPVNGYTPSVKMFCDGARPVRTIRARLLPRDGGDPDEAGALNLTQAQYEEIWRAAEQGRAALAPQSEPEDVLAWLEECRRQNEDGGAGILCRPTVETRTFEELPRVMKCVDERKAVIFFNPSDNPYGNPKEVIADLRKKSAAYIRERFYGQAERTISVLIPRFKRKVHVIPSSAIPARGANFMFYDPASDRNSFMSWFRRCGKKAYLYREWPGKYIVPGIGTPGPWAIPSGRKDGLNDGARGEGQGPWGFGNLRYKFEIARMERWEDWRQWAEGTEAQRHKAGESYPEERELEEWDERNGAGEIITARYIDSRAASAPRIEKDRPVTLQTLFDEIRLYFYLTPGADIVDGVARINAALDYEEMQPPSPGGSGALRKAEGTLLRPGGYGGQGRQRAFVNEPEFYVSEECENSIYALENWMNADGQEGATKDPIDLIRYFFMADCEDTGPGDYAARGGVSYARQAPAAGGEYGRMRWKGRRLPV